MTDEVLVKRPIRAAGGRSFSSDVDSHDSKFRRVPWLFVLVVVLPTVLAAIYYLLIASPIYVSEAQFVATVQNATQTTGGLDSLLSSVGVSAGSQDTVTAYEVENYMTSRDEINDLVKHANLLAIVGRPGGDFLYRFPRPFGRDDLEGLYKAFPRFVQINYSPQTGMSTLRVMAFRPRDAQHLAEALLNQSEAWVAALNARALNDTLAQSQRQVEDAEAAVAKAQAALTVYRNSQGIIDPDKTATADLQLMGQLEGQVDALKAQRNAISVAAPRSPQLPLLDQQIAAFEGQISAEHLRQVGQAGSLAPKIAEYQSLLLSSQLASKALESSLAELESARLDGRRQQVFLEPVIYPVAPDRAEEPHRFRMIALIFVSALLIYGILALVIAGLREHQQR